LDFNIVIRIECDNESVAPRFCNALSVNQTLDEWPRTLISCDRHRALEPPFGLSRRDGLPSY
jgi:hypothetical protein